jgi:hypothetical protein
MKRIALITLGWSLAKSTEELEQDKAYIAEILGRIGMGDRFNPYKHYYDLDLEVGTEALEIVMKELEAGPDLGYLSRVDRSYTPQELESALLLIWGPTNQAIEDDYYDLHMDGYQGGDHASHKRCPACRTELEQIRDLMVNKALMRGKHVSLTYSFEVILSEWVARLFQEAGLTGFDLRPVRHYKKPYKGEPALYQLVVTNVLPPMVSPPTEFDPVQHCDVCGRTSVYLKHVHWWGKIEYREDTDVYYPRRVLEAAKDFNHSAEYFGDLAVSHPYIIITRRVYRLLREHKVKNWAAVPVYLVD